MSYFYIGMVSFFLLALIVVAAAMDKEDMQERD